MRMTHLHEEEEVRVLALRGRPLALLDVVTSDINTLGITEVHEHESDAADNENGPSSNLAEAVLRDEGNGKVVGMETVQTRPS
jgi:hypothetical protein